MSAVIVVKYGPLEDLLLITMTTIFDPWTQAFHLDEFNNKYDKILSYKNNSFTWVCC